MQIIFDWFCRILLHVNFDILEISNEYFAQMIFRSVIISSILCLREF